MKKEQGLFVFTAIIVHCQLAKRMGVSQQTISKFETRKVTSRIDFVERLLKTMGYTIKIERVKEA
ncbi:MAG: hypothetical protein DRP27_03830 [Thermotogae bacterium]|nr:MAG: hypothetical protein DRP27_03830 [Thermotogota bacterium]